MMRTTLILTFVCLIMLGIGMSSNIGKAIAESKTENLLLVYKGYTSITGYGQSAKEVLGIDNVEYVVVTYEYYVIVNLSLNLSSLNHTECSSTLNVSNIVITIQPENESFQPPSTPLIMEIGCSSEPFILLLRNGSFEIANYPSARHLQGFTRMDVDTAHYVFHMKIIMFNESRDQSWSIYVEPLTKIPVLVSFDEQRQVDGSDSLTLHSVVYLENPRGIFRKIISRDVYDFLIEDVGVSGSVVVIHPVLSEPDWVNATVQGNNTLLVMFSVPKTCFVVINVPEEISIEFLNLEMNTYLGVGSTIYYSKSPSMCSELVFSFNRSISMVFKPSFPEKGVNPRYVPPSIDYIATALIFNSITSYLAYLTVSKLHRIRGRRWLSSFISLLRRFL